jgi:hypothetical protein
LTSQSDEDSNKTQHQSLPAKMSRRNYPNKECWRDPHSLASRFHWSALITPERRDSLSHWYMTSVWHPWAPTSI